MNSIQTSNELKTQQYHAWWRWKITVMKIMKEVKRLYQMVLESVIRVWRKNVFDLVSLKVLQAEAAGGGV